MKRATTKAQRLALELTRAYSDSAAALPRRTWTRPTTQTQSNAPDPAPLNPNQRQGLQLPWDTSPRPEPERRFGRPGQVERARQGQGPGQGRRDAQGQGQGRERYQQNGPGRNQWEQRGRDQRAQQPQVQAWPELPGLGSREQVRERGPPRPDQGGRSHFQPPSTIYPRTSAPSRTSAPTSRPEREGRPPARSWAVSVPTPGLEEETEIGGRKREKERREWATKEDLQIMEAEAEAIRRKKAQQKVKLIEVEDRSRDIYVPTVISVSNLARLLNVRIGRLQDKMYAVGMEETAYDHILTSDDASLLALEFGFNPVVDEDAAFDVYPEHPHPDPSSLPLRPPVVTIMGHVDHGKTTLLDTLRSASVAAGEAGGITQHIGAFSVPLKNASQSSNAPKTVTFLDTPGHAAFSAMRARGAGVTDIVVLVVAADDGVMPQTREVIELTKGGEGGVQLVVAINKCDKPGVNTDKVKRALLSEGVQLEEFGGDIPSVEVSGLTGQGLDTLVETLSTLAEMAELRAEVDLRAHGRVLESRIDKGRGPVATVLIQRGSLKPGSSIVAGTAWARVRQMTDDKNRPVKLAKPGDAVTVAGWKEVPAAGDEVLQAEKEDDAKKAVANRKRVMETRALAEDVEKINEKRRMDKVLEEQEREAEAAASDDLALDKPLEVVQSNEPEVKELKLVIKGDVSGSVEAVAGALCGIGNKIARVKIVSQTVGDVSESDIARAKAVDGMVVGFNVSAPAKIQQIASQQGVPLLSENIIYKLMDEIKKRVVALLPVTYEQRVLGEATVQEIFTIALKGKATMNIAGCRVTNGVIGKHAKVRVVRDGTDVYDGTIDTLKQQKKDMTEMRKGNECGMSFAGFEDLKPGDHIQTYETIEKPGVL
ncbi:Translation initiation factor IF-2 [Magnetospirillum magneticum AMB-1] [Rhizoctonia solani]|uniref:Translation initiation factor IF-2, mitochondrial n=1 Tax=Rhizoctonia solani TaxID=456999 RepID=A0A0K6FQN3_9AGAM|nr:Translation initiation factor IF-2 [Magnetospirillum magneticum AMB-1] [Rhizoctonia solani]